MPLCIRNKNILGGGFLLTHKVGPRSEQITYMKLSLDLQKVSFN